MIKVQEALCLVPENSDAIALTEPSNQLLHPVNPLRVRGGSWASQLGIAKIVTRYVERGFYADDGTWIERGDSRAEK